MTFSKITLVAAMVATTLLSACGGSKDGETVRNGPQAVHPSPSALAASGLSY
ncbi:MAG: hypothetical protein WA790_13845 [Sulfitobacter sp.]